MFKHDLLYDTPSYLIVLVLAALMLAAIYAGLLYARKRNERAENTSERSGAIIAAIFALLGFILAFTYNMSESRYDKRRQNIVEESNNIGTALLRCDLYPDSVRNSLRAGFYHYILARIDHFDSGRDDQKAREAFERGDRYSKQLWKTATDYSKTHPTQLVASNQMIPALNAMIDIVTTRQASFLATVPPLIVLMLFLLCISAGFFSGYSIGNRKPDKAVVAGFIITISMVVFITLDLDRPYRGIITMNQVEQNIVNLQQQFTSEEIKLYKEVK
ncbi:MAG TPA: hypothetical protein VIZ28_18935 [Chitinophagaceae bacterium]